MEPTKYLSRSKTIVKFRISEMLDRITYWMEENRYGSIKMMQSGMSQKKVGEPAAFELANYMKTLQSFKEGMF